jgi:hypothetical protein
MNICPDIPHQKRAGFTDNLNKSTKIQFAGQLNLWGKDHFTSLAFQLSNFHPCSGKHLFDCGTASQNGPGINSQEAEEPCPGENGRDC